jgi:hypothetical protein
MSMEVKARVLLESKGYKVIPPVECWVIYYPKDGIFSSQFKTRESCFNGRNKCHDIILLHFVGNTVTSEFIPGNK